MASTTTGTTHDAYTQPTASTLATRALVADTKPAVTPTPVNSPNANTPSVNSSTVNPRDIKPTGAPTPVNNPSANIPSANNTTANPRDIKPTGTPTPAPTSNVNPPTGYTRDIDTCKPGSVARLTDNYMQAAAAATKASAVPGTPTRGLGAVSGTDRPGVQRLQSWKMSDMKRQQHEQMMDGQQMNAQGYGSTAQK
ncbi:hypothetical protein LTR08_004980 [Meristemomyces frigidus]|nr:hypothetical protein LTR08_004980 [Meristemomyces frigidus]